jgi:SAM-dependent methyltransferase
MDTFQANTYGERIAVIYDELYADFDPAAIAALSKLARPRLAQGELARPGIALELGIGTGRIAIPLQQTGVEVHGIDASAAMVDRLRLKPGGDGLPVAMGDFADVAVEGQYNLIYVLFNTFFALPTQEEQLRCFRNVARHLAPQGVFVIEAFVPDLTRFVGQQAVRAIKIDNDRVQLDVSRHDPVTQQIISQHVMLTEQGIRLFPVKLRYAWPSELDLMARLVGLQLKERWGNWQGGAFSAESGKHISIYAHPDHNQQ